MTRPQTTPKVRYPADSDYSLRDPIGRLSALLRHSESGTKLDFDHSRSADAGEARTHGGIGEGTSPDVRRSR